MREDQKRKLALLLIVIVILGSFGGWLYVQRQLPNDNNLFWLVSGHCDTNDNETYSVILGGVNFTFLYKAFAPLDAGIPVFFKVTFPDGTIEFLENVIGGGMLTPPRIVLSSHTSPQAAIVCSYGREHEQWYGWYYAVSL